MYMCMLVVARDSLWWHREPLTGFAAPLNFDGRRFPQTQDTLLGAFAALIACE